MLFVDTSVWSLALRRSEPPSCPQLDVLKQALTTGEKVVTRVLNVIIRALSTAVFKRADLSRSGGAQSGIVTFIQRFGSALNLNIRKVFQSSIKMLAAIAKMLT